MSPILVAVAVGVSFASVVAAAGISNCASFPVQSVTLLDAGTYLPDKDGRRDYTRFTDASGVKILGVDGVSDYVLADAARVITGIMDRIKPQLADALRAKKQRIYIVPDTKGIGLTSKNWCWIPTSDGPEKCNVQDWESYGYLIHEYGHAVNGVFDSFDRSLQTRLDAAYANAKRRKIWPDSYYGMLSSAEYFGDVWRPMWFKIDHTCGGDASFCSKELVALRDPEFSKFYNAIRVGSDLDLSCATRCDPKTVVREDGLPASCQRGVRITSLFDGRSNEGSAAKCYAKCTAEKKCRAASYNSKSQFGTDCFLYNAPTEKLNDPNWTSCFKV